MKKSRRARLGALGACLCLFGTPALGLQPGVGPEALPEPTPEPDAAPAAEPAPQTAPPLAPAPALSTPTPATSRWSLSISGFIEADAIYDTTQSFNDLAGNAVIAAPGTLAGENDRMTLSMRNSRIGFRMKAPEVDGLRASGFLELDAYATPAPGVSEGGLFASPALRFRHALVKVESDILDVCFGQTWSLFAWQPLFHPNTVDIQGVPGQPFGRTVQLRVSRLFHTQAVDVEAAVAAARPAQRDSGLPDGQGGLRFALNHWKGLHTGGSGASQTIDGLGLGVSGLVRRLEVVDFIPPPTARSNSATGWAVSIDGLFPIIPATPDDRGNSLTLQASFVTGTGFSDQYTGLTGGIAYPALPNPDGSTPAPSYTANLDGGLVTYDAEGRLETIDWTSFLAGLQYYLPPTGDLWFSANYAQASSGNIDDLATTPGTVFRKTQYFNANFFWNIVPSTRVGLGHSRVRQTFGDDTTRNNSRVQLAAYFLF